MSAIWSGVIGHQRQLAELEAGLAAGRGAHAYLFCGPDGVGKRTIALGLAQRLNCTGDTPPCGQCAGCRQVAARTHPELRLIEPESQGEGGRNAIHRVETARALEAETHLRPFERMWRVIVLNAADKLTEPAANTLLKSLEEPPEQVVWVLCSEEPAALLPTIWSRVRPLRFSPVPRAAIEQWLRGTWRLAEEESRIAAGLAAGRPGRALLLAREPAARALRARMVELAEGAPGRPPAAALLAAEQLRAAVADEALGAGAFELALEMLEWWYRDALVLKVTGRADRLVAADLADSAGRAAAGHAVAELRDALVALHQARLAYRRNANLALLCEVLCLRLGRAARV